MKRVQVQFETADLQALRARAYRARKPVAAVVREAVREWLTGGQATVAPPPDPRKWRFIGIGASRQDPKRPVSIHHDEALAEVFAHDLRRHVRLLRRRRPA